MKYKYRTSGTCSSEIKIETDDKNEKIKKVEYTAAATEIFRESPQSWKVWRSMMSSKNSKEFIVG